MPRALLGVSLRDEEHREPVGLGFGLYAPAFRAGFPRKGGLR